MKKRLEGIMIGSEEISIIVIFLGKYEVIGRVEVVGIDRSE